MSEERVIMTIACDDCRYFVVNDEGMYCMKVKEYFFNGWEAKKHSEICGENMMKLNFGCGRDIKKDFVNVDFRPGVGVDKVFNFDKPPYPFEDNTFEEVICYHVLEHLQFVPDVLSELHRICKKDAIIYIKVPYYNHPCAWVDCTHMRGFTKDTLDDFSVDQPSYGTYENTYPKFKITKKLNPGVYGKYIPGDKLKLYLSYAFGMILKEIEFTLVVVK
jgi:SAM-dependent methyltransferase